MPYDRLDGQPDPNAGPTVSCFVMGGCANGVTLPEIVATAKHIELKRPSYIKPLASAVQKVPEIAKESDRYEVHPVGFPNVDGSLEVFAIAVVEGKTLTWAVRQLIVAYAEKSVAELRAAGVTPPGTKPNKRH